MTPEVTVHTVKAMDSIGAEAKQFLQGMLNRLAIGALRYGRNDPQYYIDNDMYATAKLRIDAALETKDRNLLIDAANFCLLVWLHAPESPVDGGEDSPGVVKSDGSIWGQRGKYA